MRFIAISYFLSSTLLLGSLNSVAFPHAEIPANIQSLKHQIIYGGKLASKSGTAWKSVVRIETDTISCTGMIIGAQSILTAAHCMQQETKTISVQLFRGPRVALTHKFYEDEFRISSRNYRKGSTNEADNDMAVITVNRRIISDEHEAISLFTSDDLPLIKVDRAVHMIGAGSKGNGEYSEELRFTEGVIADYRSTSMKVAAHDGTAICPGDSGGALTVPVGNEHRLVGVLSGFILENNYPDEKKTCGNSALYSFLTDAKSNWIDETIADHLNQLK